MSEPHYRFHIFSFPILFGYGTLKPKKKKPHYDCITNNKIKRAVKKSYHKVVPAILFFYFYQRWLLPAALNGNYYLCVGQKKKTSSHNALPGFGSIIRWAKAPNSNMTNGRQKGHQRHEQHVKRHFSLVYYVLVLYYATLGCGGQNLQRATTDYWRQQRKTTLKHFFFFL